MPNSFSVLILDGSDSFVLKVLRCLGRDPKVTSHILSRSRKTIAGYSRYCRKSHYNWSHNDAEWIEVIRDVARRCKIDVLLPTTIESIEFVSRNYDALSKIASVPPTPNSEQLNITQDKWSFYCFVKEHEFPTAESILFAEDNNIICKTQPLNSIEFPVLLKPTKEAGGRGIIRIDSQSELFSIIKQKKLLVPKQRYVLQSYIPGEDLCLGALCKNGEILSYVLHKDLLPPSNSFGHQKVMEFVHNDSVIEVGRKLFSALGWNGMAFIDFRIDRRDNSIKLLEVNPRLGRAFLGALSAGVNFPLNLCCSAMGMEIHDKQKSVRYSHPSAYLKILRSRIIGRPVPIRLKIWESGFRYLVSDPLPEFFGLARRARKIKLLQSLRNRKRIGITCVENRNVTSL